MKTNILPSIGISLCLACAPFVVDADAQLSPPAEIHTIAGSGAAEENGRHGPALQMNIGDPFGVEWGPDDCLYVTEVRNHRVWKIDMASGQAMVIAGTSEKGFSGDGGPATEARLNEPYEVRFDSAGNMYFVEMQNHLVRMVERSSGLIHTIAGTGTQGFSGDGGLATEATFSRPHSIALDANDNLYIADIGNHRIRRVDRSSGFVETIAGNETRRLPVDKQPARGNPILGPRALFIQNDELWIALREGNSVWRMSLDDGILHHVAGTGQAGFSGDGGPAKNATFNGPKGITVGHDGRVFVVDTENHAIRAIHTGENRITTVAGDPPHRGGIGDGGSATTARMDRPHGIGIAPNGSLFVGDTLNHRVREVRFLDE